MLRHTYREALSVFPGAVTLCVAGETNHPFFEQLGVRDGEGCYQQRGGNLGERMLDALQNCATAETATQTKKIVIGSDCPWITGHYLQRAAKELNCAAVVIVPARDGGYVLIAMREPMAELFSDIEWGSSRVLVQTMRQVAKLGLDCRLLPELTDIDRPADLARLADTNLPPALQHFSRGSYALTVVPKGP